MARHLSGVVGLGVLFCNALNTLYVAVFGFAFVMFAWRKNLFWMKRSPPGPSSSAASREIRPPGLPLSAAPPANEIVPTWTSTGCGQIRDATLLHVVCAAVAAAAAAAAAAATFVLLCSLHVFVEWLMLII